MSVPSRAPAASKAEDVKGYLVVPISPTPFGKYTIIGKLGHGGMAEVNLAVVGGKAGFRKLFVVKRLHAHLEVEPGFVDMFLDEARLAAQLDHPNCVQTVEVGEAEGPGPTGHMLQHFLAMEYLDGQGLERLLRITGQRGDILPIHTSARMIADALDGLGYAHDLRGYDGTPLGVVHRDVSPQNIFVTYAGVVKLLDFGIAKAESNVVETRTGVVKGKYAYIAPEQALAAPVDRRADLWSMGVVLWEMLTSRRLFKSVNELATLNETLRGEIHPPSRYNPQVPPELDAVVLRALQREVDQRYRTAHEFKDALESWLATQPEPSDRKAIAELMKERFGDIIELHKERLRECIASVAQDSRSLDRLVLGGTHSSSMEGDAMSSGSHPGAAHGPSAQLAVDPSGARPLPQGPHGGPGHSMTPTPSPRPRLGLSVSGSITSGMPPIDAIAPRGSHPPGLGGHTPSGAVAMPASGAISMTPAPMPSGPMSSGPMSSGPMSSGPMSSGPMSSGPMALPSSSGVVLAPPSGASAEWSTSSGFAAPPTTPSRSRSVAWGLLALAACVVSAVVAIVAWTSWHGMPTSALSDATVGATTPAIGTVVPPTPTGTDGVGEPDPGGGATAADPTLVAAAVVGTETSAPSVEEASTEPSPSRVPSGRHDRRRPSGGGGPQTEHTPEPATQAPAPAVEATQPSAPEPARGPGFLSLVTSPWTQVTLEGRALGETPLVRVPLPAGTHTLRLRNSEAHIDESYEVTIRAGETTSRRLGLR